MLQLITLLILMVSSGVIIYIVIRTLPRLTDDTSNGSVSTLYNRWIQSGIPERLDAFLNTFLEKVLRKVKVYLLRIDNKLSGRLRKIKDDNEKKESLADDFRKLNGESHNESENNSFESKSSDV